MELDLTGPHREDAYRILSGLVTPRPIALTTTVDPEGRVNAAPFSFFNVLGDSPPIVGLCPGDRSPGIPKDTARNIRLTHEFVVNLVDEALAEAMVRTAASVPYGESETKREKLATSPSTTVGPPRIKAAPAALECNVHSIQQIGENRLILGIVHRVHVRKTFYDAKTQRIRGEKFHPIGRMAVPDWYCRTGDLFEMKRPE